MPKRKILHNFVRHISSHVFRAWSVEHGAWSVMEAATQSPHTEKGAWRRRRQNRRIRRKEREAMRKSNDLFSKKSNSLFSK